MNRSLCGEEDEDVESAYTRSGEESTVPPTPAEYNRSKNTDWAFQRERVSLGFYASVSTSRPVLPHHSSLPPQSLALSRIAWLNTAILVVYFLEQNADSFEGVHNTYQACRQLRDQGPPINTKDIKGLSTGPVSPARGGRGVG